MSTKEIVPDLLRKLPGNISLHNVAKETEFVAASRQGLAEIEGGERIPLDSPARALTFDGFLISQSVRPPRDVVRFRHGECGNPEIREIL